MSYFDTIARTLCVRMNSYPYILSHMCFRECPLRGSSPSMRAERPPSFVKSSSATSPRFSHFPSPANGMCMNQPQASPRRFDPGQTLRYFGPTAPIGSCGLSARVYAGYGHHHQNHRNHQRYPSLPSPTSPAIAAPCIAAGGVGIPGHMFGIGSTKTRSYQFLYPS